MEEKIVIHGGKPVIGEITVSGAKNSAVAILPAALLADDVCVIENLPDINDVRVLQKMMEALGAVVTFENNTMTIDPTQLSSWVAPAGLANRMRASYYLIGALLGRFGKAEVSAPGGCDIGARPIDQHLKGLRALGATVDMRQGTYHCFAEKLTGTQIYLDMPSVGATIHIMLAAAKAEGMTTISNAAREPHVVDVANFLSAMGARVKGAGTDEIRVYGCSHLRGVHYSIVPDQIETGTWMCIAAGTRGDITVKNCVPVHMEAVTGKLREMGHTVIEDDDSIRVIGCEHPNAVKIKTQPYPGFPTDMQQPFCVLMSVAEGVSMVHETLYENRFGHVEHLRSMGADITVADRVALITGVKELWGKPVMASDLRAGAAMIVAGLIAGGETTISNVRFIDRGYDRIVEKLAAMGADVKRIRSKEQ